jgi:hypothetical protein
MKDDPGLEAVRAVRLAISREFGNDPARLIAHYIEMQSQCKIGSIIEGPGTTVSDVQPGVAGFGHPGGRAGGLAPHR